MFCNKCGYKLGSSPFCSHCGAPASQQQQREQMHKQSTTEPVPDINLTPPEYYIKQQPQSSKGFLIVIIVAIVAIVAILAVVVITFLNSGNSNSGKDDSDDKENSDDKEKSERDKADYEPEDYIIELLEAYGESVIECDADTYLGLFPDDVADYILEQYGSEDAVIENLESELAFFEDTYGDNIKFEFAVKDCTELDETDTEVVIGVISNLYDCEVDVEKAYDIEYTIYVEGDDDSAESKALETTVIVVDDEWYMTE